MGSYRQSPLIRTSGTFSHKGRRRASSLFQNRISLLSLWEKVDRAKRETDEGFFA